MKIVLYPKMMIIQERRHKMNFTRESVFISAIRSFCTSVAVILGLSLGIGIVGIGLAVMMGPQFLPPKANPMIMPNAKGERTILSGHTPAILRLDFNGVIGMGDLTSEKVMNLLLDSRDDFLKGDRVKAVLLHMNTPGGTVTDADAIYRALIDYKTKYKVPVYVYVDGLCASGGMYISSAADKIFASPASVIGSVGVIMGPTFNFSDAMSRYGISSLTLTEGKDKDALNPFRPWRPGEDDSLKAVMASLYDRFVTIVSTARPKLTRDKLVNEYGAHVFVAKEAQELGYIDVAGVGYSRALTALAEAAQLTEDYQVVQLTPQHSLFDGISQSTFPQKILQWMGLSRPEQAELNGKLLYLYNP